MVKETSALDCGMVMKRVDFVMNSIFPTVDSLYGTLCYVFEYVSFTTIVCGGE